MSFDLYLLTVTGSSFFLILNDIHLENYDDVAKCPCTNDINRCTSSFVVGSGELDSYLIS